jgi:uncharacterized protein (TIGR03437 family)
MLQAIIVGHVVCVTCLLGQAVPEVAAVVNGGSFQERIAPGAIVSIFGNDLADRTEVSAGIPLATELSGITITFNGKPAPLLGVFDGVFNQINAVVPWQLGKASSASVVAWRGGEAITEPLEVQVSETAPAMFEFPPGSGEGIVTFNPNTGFSTWARCNGPSPRPGEIVVIWLTGLGAVDVAVVDGLPGPLAPLAVPLAEVKVLFDGVEAEILAVLLHPTLVGLFQINAIVPPDLDLGGLAQDTEFPLVIEAGVSRAEQN